MNVLTTETMIPAFDEILIIANKVRMFARPGLSQGKIRGRGDSAICRAAAAADNTAIIAISLNGVREPLLIAV
jgi:hypothetical protein